MLDERSHLVAVRDTWQTLGGPVSMATVDGDVEEQRSGLRQVYLELFAHTGNDTLNGLSEQGVVWRTRLDGEKETRLEDTWGEGW